MSTIRGATKKRDREALRGMVNALRSIRGLAPLTQEPVREFDREIDPKLFDVPFSNLTLLERCLDDDGNRHVTMSRFPWRKE